MSSDQFIKTKTTDHTEVYIRKEHVSAVEHIPGKGGLDAIVKLYVNGYSFKLKGTMKEYMQELGIPYNPSESQD